GAAGDDDGLSAQIAVSWHGVSLGEEQIGLHLFVGLRILFAWTHFWNASRSARRTTGWTNFRRLENSAHGSDTFDDVAAGDGGAGFSAAGYEWENGFARRLQRGASARGGIYLQSLSVCE